MAETENEEQGHDVHGLLRKNAELLGELKAAKAKVAELEAERDAALAKAAEAEATMRQTLLDAPVERTLGEAFSLPWRHMRPAIEEHFTFALGEDGKPVATPTDGGEPVPLDQVTRMCASIPDLAVALRPAQGGGARSSGEHVADPDAGKPRPESLAGPFGLR
ncbi:hypothetical protein [Rhodovulum sp.]|uniref:hypothetical protein n=1 Tax=Rhodovulum sp. TaxID=34009 RepID=UPI0017987968|nr:hypothetical protein [Rhodovulum sp.]HDR28854.1 hypothetical protein [Rhodovulum sp.]